MIPEFIRLDATAYITHAESGMEVAMKLGSLPNPDRLFDQDGMTRFLNAAIQAAEGFTGVVGGWRAMTKTEIDNYIAREENGEDYVDGHDPDCDGSCGEEDEDTGFTDLGLDFDV